MLAPSLSMASSQQLAMMFAVISNRGWAALEAEVAAAAEAVVEAVIVGGADGVVAGTILPPREIDDSYALGTGGVAALPIVGAAGILDEVALEDQVAGSFSA